VQVTEKELPVQPRQLLGALSPVSHHGAAGGSRESELSAWPRPGRPRREPRHRKPLHPAESPSPRVCHAGPRSGSPRGAARRGGAGTGVRREPVGPGSPLPSGRPASPRGRASRPSPRSLPEACAGGQPEAPRAPGSGGGRAAPRGRAPHAPAPARGRLGPAHTHTPPSSLARPGSVSAGPLPARHPRCPSAVPPLPGLPSARPPLTDLAPQTLQHSDLAPVLIPRLGLCRCSRHRRLGRSRRRRSSRLRRRHGVARPAARPVPQPRRLRSPARRSPAPPRPGL
jgi:hypothetical protein